MMKIIDPHIHLFDLEKGNYNWLKPDNQPHWEDKHRIYRSFSQHDLVLAPAHELAGFVHIEAGFNNDKPWQEIQWLEDTVTVPFRSIAAIDLTLDPAKFIDVIEKLLNYHSVVGGRHIFDEEAVTIMTHPNTARNLATLERYNLLFETQFVTTDASAVEAYHAMVNNYPRMSFVLSHACFCPLEQTERVHWQDNLQTIAQADNVFIKASGWEMSSRAYTQEYVDNTIGALVKIFGVERVMLASNFPLTLFSASYQALWQKYSDLTLSDTVIQQLAYSNARMIYRFDCSV